MFCPSNAYIDIRQYEIVGPKDNEDFRQRYVPELATKYPPLKDAYSLLLDCWKHYHPSTIPQELNKNASISK